MFCTRWVAGFLRVDKLSFYGNGCGKKWNCLVGLVKWDLMSDIEECTCLFTEAEASCGLPMCFRCGHAMSEAVKNHRCADIREEVGSYEICSNCYAGALAAVLRCLSGPCLGHFMIAEDRMAIKFQGAATDSTDSTFFNLLSLQLQ